MEFQNCVDAVMTELSADAGWPAEETAALGPWMLRATRGYSHRANSVRTAARAVDPLPWEELISRAEDFYRTRSLPAIFQISPASLPTDLDQLLAMRGYARERQSQVWAADVHEVLQLTPHASNRGIVVRSEEPNPGWLSCAVDESIGKAILREQICRRIPKPKTFLGMEVNGKLAARGQGVCHAGLSWIYCMATEPDFRKQGLASHLIHQIARWADFQGSRRLFLQVMNENGDAMRLYGRTGFQRVYDYHYRARSLDSSTSLIDQIHNL
jgi:GNAT superfamily N-acetyltransferase